jgi:hypothetical protein
MNKINYPIIFTHVPRSGGITLNGIFKNNFPLSQQLEFEIADYYGTTQIPLALFDKMPQAEKDKFLFLTGHINFGLHEYYEQPCTYLTFFRNPISRIASYYGIISNNEKHYLYKTVNDNRLDINSFLKLKLSAEFDNAQVRQISGIKGVKPGKCNEEMLEKAIDNLEKYYPVFGLTDKYDESLLVLSKYYNFPTPYYSIQNQGRNSKDIKITQEVKDTIRETNHLDIKFHEYALRRFETLTAQYGESFNEDVIRFKKNNDLLKKLKIGNLSLGVMIRNYYIRNKIK